MAHFLKKTFVDIWRFFSGHTGDDPDCESHPITTTYTRAPI